MNGNILPANQVRVVAVVGTGTIGASWAALFLARGFEVRASDPAPGAAGRLHERVRAAWPALTSLGLVVPGAIEAPGFCEDLREAAAGADFVQENVPEDETLKMDTLAAIDQVLAPDRVIASSTSSYLVSRLASRATRAPGRIVLGHPFTPPHLVPLVEVASGEHTDPAAVDCAMDVYRRLGQHPIRLKREVYRHVSNRLQSVLWNEAIRLVDEGVVSAADVDAAVCMGPGMRWAFMGPVLSHHFAGGPGGLERALEMFGAAEGSGDDRARRLQPSPALREALVEGVAEQTGNRDAAELAAWRDRMLLAVRLAVQGARDA